MTESTLDLLIERFVEAIEGGHFDSAERWPSIVFSLRRLWENTRSSS